MDKKLAIIKGVGYKAGYVNFTVSIIDSMERGFSHDLEVILKNDENLTLDKISEIAKEKEKVYCSDPDRERKDKIAEDFLGKEFEIELDDQND